MAFLVVAHVENTLLQHVTESEYDLSNRPSRVKTHKVTKDDAGNITSEHIYTGEVAYDDAFGRLTEFDEKVGATHTAYTTTFGYDEENRPTSLEYGSHGESTIEYDGLGRVAKTTVKAGSGAEASTAYTYVAGAALETKAPDDADDERKEAAANAAGKTSTTGLVQSITQTGGNFTYTYDDNGNITSVVQDDVETVYTYDALGQLIRVVDGQEGATWEYAYDQGGNILSKKKFVDGKLDESMTFGYVHEGSNLNEKQVRENKWHDLLKYVNGQRITYDEIGNPLNDGTWQYEWVNGRQLARMHSVDTDASFVYNENGLRVRKTVNGVVTDYTLHGKNVVHMKRSNDELHFFYDASNKPAVVVYNGVPYSYVKNLQGDIVALLDSTGAVVVAYTYDAWGRPISKNGSMAATLGTVQPFRYRGYVFDEEAGLYYLQSRYYSPGFSRFINNDQYASTGQGLLDSNMFLYCANNPICRYDDTGNFFNTICGAIVGGVMSVFCRGEDPKESAGEAFLRGFTTGALAGAALDFCVVTAGVGGLVVAGIGGAAVSMLDTWWEAENNDRDVSMGELAVSGLVGGGLNLLFGAFGRVAGRATGRTLPGMLKAMTQNTVKSVTSRHGKFMGGKLLKEFVMNTLTSLSQFWFGKGFSGIGNEYLEEPSEE